MDVLIVEYNPELGLLWKSHIERLGHRPILVHDDETALNHLRGHGPDVIVIDLDLPEAGATAVADYVAYRHPNCRIVLVTASSFFSDGSIFALSPNVCAFLPALTSPEDIAAVVEFHGQRKAAAC